MSHADSTRYKSFLAFNYKYFPTSSLHTPDVDLLGVVGGISEEDADRPLPVRRPQSLVSSSIQRPAQRRFQSCSRNSSSQPINWGMDKATPLGLKKLNG